MQYMDIEPPECIAFGALRRVGWNTTIVQALGGAEVANQNWTKRRHTFDISFAIRTVSAYDSIDQHHTMARGKAKVFPFKDFLDFQVTRERGQLVVDPSSGDPAFWLAKTYGTGPDQYVRFITRPRSGTVAIFRLRGATTADITSSATIDYSTGRLVIDDSALQVGDLLSWTGEFRVPCRYDTDDLPGMTPNRQPGDEGELYVQCDSIQLVEHKEGPDT